MTVATLIKATFSTAQTVSHTGAGASFSALGNPLSEPAQEIIVSSTFNDGQGAPISCWISIDGINNHILVPGNKVFPIDISSNKQGTGKFALPKGTQFYVKQGPDGAPTAGDLSITTLYAR